jgi:polysaccharide transporter, PST family
MRLRETVAKIGGDAFAVGAGQLISFAFPLVSLPLLARILGSDSLGRLIVVLAVVQLLVRLCDYGFSVSAVRRIAVARDRRERSEAIFATLAAVAFLWTCGTVALVLIASAIPDLRQDLPLFLVGALSVAAGLGFPSWLLQGLRRLKTYALLTAMARILALVGLVLTVHDVDDIAWAVVWQFSPAVFASLVAWPLLVRGPVEVRVPRLASVRAALHDGRQIFLASLAQSVLGSAPAITIGAVSVPHQVALYGAAERFGNAGRGVLFAVTDALLPQMLEARDSRTREGRTQRVVLRVGLLALFALSGLVLVVVAPWFVPWYLGHGFDGAVRVTRIIGLTLVICGGVAVLSLEFNAEHRYSTTMFAAAAGAVVHLLVLFPLAVTYGAEGGAWAVAIAETATLLWLSVVFVRDRRRSGREPGARGSSASAVGPPSSDDPALIAERPVS